MTTALRSFLHYGRYLGEVSLDLAAAVPIVANWSMTSIPRAISAEHVRQLLASIDRRTAVGRRDYAILLLLARLGLRSGEVAFLELDDIDWNAGQVSVRSKGGQRNTCPYPQRSAKRSPRTCGGGDHTAPAAAYFCEPKPRSAPFAGRVGLAPSFGIRSNVPASMPLPKGAHQFRHGLATEMLRQGASLSEIGELLGHRHPQTTKIYTKVDIKALRTLALPWPGGVR